MHTLQSLLVSTCFYLSYKNFYPWSHTNACIVIKRFLITKSFHLIMNNRNLTRKLYILLFLIKLSGDIRFISFSYLFQKWYKKYIINWHISFFELNDINLHNQFLSFLYDLFLFFLNSMKFFICSNKFNKFYLKMQSN